MPGICVDVSETRSAPSELGTPAPSDFHLNIVRQSNGVAIYDGAFTTDKIKAAPDTYDISVACGTNPLLGLDAPYYIGTATATVVSTTEPTEVAVPVKVGNALVSAVFGDTEENAARFERFFDNCSVDVSIGTTSASITRENNGKSVYVRPRRCPTPSTLQTTSSSPSDWNPMPRAPWSTSRKPSSTA